MDKLEEIMHDVSVQIGVCGMSSAVRGLATAAKSAKLVSGVFRGVFANKNPKRVSEFCLVPYINIHEILEKAS